ncbi:MAG: hypothetical protein ABGX27_07140 [Desulfurobacteriaceae bacterium]
MRKFFLFISFCLTTQPLIANALNIQECTPVSSNEKLAIDNFKKAQKLLSQKRYKEAEEKLVEAINLFDANSSEETVSVEFKCLTPLPGINLLRYGTFREKREVEYYPKKLLSKLRKSSPPKIFVIVEEAPEKIKVEVFNVKKVFKKTETGYISSLYDFKVKIWKYFSGSDEVECSKIQAGEVCEKELKIGHYVVNSIDTDEKFGLKLFDVRE